MNILKINTTPIFEFIPRTQLLNTNLTIEIVSESSSNVQTINCVASVLSNENYNLLLATFPTGQVNEKFSYTIFNGLEKISLGKLILISSTEVVQDFSKKSVNKFYK